MKSIKILLAIFLTAVGVAAMAADKRFTLVIDAGHGGHDSGAKGAMSYEKNINLKVALAFGKYVERGCPDVKVVYTRKTDVFVALYERAEIANRNKANLFVSVHTNALPKGRISRGFETYTLGDGRSHGKQTNLDVAKRENSVIFMEKDYKQHYVGYDPNSAESNIMFEFVQDHNMQQSVEFAKMLQRNVCAAAGRVNKGVHQDNFAVLRLTSMPACLVELGFITTPDEEKALNDATVVDQIARGLYNAFAEYKNRQTGSAVVPYKPVADKLPVEEGTAAAAKDGSAAKEAASDGGSDAAAKGKTADEAKEGAASAKGGSAPAKGSADVSSKGQSASSKGQSGRKQAVTRAAVADDGIIMYDENAGRTPRQKSDSTSARRPARRMETADEAAAVVREHAPEPTPAKPKSEGRSAATAQPTDAPVFKIQIMVCRAKLKEGDRLLKGLKGCDYYQENGSWKCTYGASTDYNEIYRLRKEVVELFPTCFIIAFKNGEKTDVAQAIREFKQNKRK